MINLDFETKSHCDLIQCGVRVYAKHPTTDVIVLSWKITGDGPDDVIARGRWHPGDKGETHNMPKALYMAIMQGDRVRAFNVSFEREIWEHVMVARYGWLPLYDHHLECTMALALYKGLPGKLSKLGEAIPIDFKKNPDGVRLISKYSKLNLKTASETIPAEDMEKWDTYCDDDVDTEEAAGEFIGPMTKSERRIWKVDQQINRRGLAIDVPLVETCIEMLKQSSVDLLEELVDLTDGAVQTARQVNELRKWLKAHDCKMDDLQAATVTETLTRKDLTPEARAGLKIRQELARASTAKLDKMLSQIDDDGRVYYNYQYHGAHTGRWTGRGVQFQNMPRPNEDWDADTLVGNLMKGDPDLIRMIYGSLTGAVSSVLRSTIIAGPGNELFCADYAGVEARVLAQVAGEEWKVEAFRNGQDMYCLAADRIYKLPLGTVTKETHPNERQDGKVGELYLGYQGALGAWRRGDKSDRHTDEEINEIVKAWRGQHPAITSFWPGINEAAIRAVQEGYAEFRGVVFETKRHWLTMRGPSGKRMWYYDPQLQMRMPAWHRTHGDAAEIDCILGLCDCKPLLTLTFMAYNATKNLWYRDATYGGKLTENYVQKECRELLAHSVLNLEAADYPVVMHTHDEAMVELPLGEGRYKKFMRLLTDWPEYAADWPLDAKGWQATRYKK